MNLVLLLYAFCIIKIWMIDNFVGSHTNWF
jgi:hypothetical protein